MNAEEENARKIRRLNYAAVAKMLKHVREEDDGA